MVLASRLLAALLLVLLTVGAGAEPLRLAVFNVELHRKGPGLLLRDIRRGEDPAIAAAVQVIAATAPDILLLMRFDWDADGLALDAFAAQLAEAGSDYPHRLALRPNTGRQSGVDLDGDGRLGGPGDAQGWGRFSGHNGMALLSRHPLGPARDLSDLLWADLPGALGPDDEDLARVQRVSTVGHWDVPVLMPGGSTLRVLAFHATPPVFDGPEDRNGRRNADEIRLWQHLLDGALGFVPEPPFAIMGGANLDPRRGEGRLDAIRDLLADPRLTDPVPRHRDGPGGPVVSDRIETVDWPEPDPGDLRVDYVLPSGGLTVTGSGVLWPAPGAALAEAAVMASRHRLVWVDVEVPQAAARGGVPSN